MAKIIQIARFTADGSQVERTFKGMGDAGQQMSQRVQQGARAIPPAMRAVDASAGVAKQKLDGLAGATGSLGTVLRSLGPIGLGAAAAIGGLSLAFSALQTQTLSAVKAIGSIDGAAQQLGISIEAVQEFRFAMASIGEEATNADAALLAFSKALGQLNTEIGKRARGALEELGFTDEDIARMTSVEVALPQIADRIQELGSASEQAAIAQKLGLEPMLELLQQGSEGFERAAAEARQYGYVIDTELVRRAAEFEDQWKKASVVIDVQFKQALVDLAPVFIDLARAIGTASRYLVDFLDNFKDIENRASRSLYRRLGELQDEERALIARFGRDNLQGGDAGRGQWTTSEFAMGLEENARNRFAYLNQRTRAINRELNDRARDMGPLFGSNSPTLPDPDAPTGGAAPTDATTAQALAFVQALRDEAAAREDLARIMSANAGLSREEAETVRQQEADLQRLNEIRELGGVITDAEFEQLSRMRVERDQHNAALRQEAEARAAVNAQRQRVAAFERGTETSQERIRREIAEAEGMRSEGASDEAVRRRVEALTEEYRELAKAQFDASVAGTLLSQAINGQIESWEDLGRTLLKLLADEAVKQLLTGNGGGAQNGGESGSGGGFDWGGFIGSIFGGIFSGGRASGGGMQPGGRHSAAEQGPELSVVGGWGQVLPNGTFEAIATLARVVQLAQKTPAAANNNSGGLKVYINNDASDVVGVSTAERQVEGMRALEVAITRKVAGDIASGELDQPMRSRFGARTPRTRRG